MQGMVALTHPGIRSDRFADAQAKLLGIGGDPVRLPVQDVQVHNGKVEALAQGAGEG
jgi:hypothetical protein